MADQQNVLSEQEIKDGWQVVKPNEPPPPPQEGENPNTLGTALRHFWQTGPVAAIGGMLPAPKSIGGSGTDHPLMPTSQQGAPNFVVQMHEVKKKADELWDKGDKVGATAKYVESVIPFLGPLMSTMGDEAQRGQWAALAGDTAGTAATTAVTANPVKAANVTGKVLSATGGAMERTATSPTVANMTGTGAVAEMVRGDPAKAMAAYAIPKGVEYLGKGMRTLGDILKDIKPLTKAETMALQAKRFDPSLRGNQPVQAAITTALQERAPAAARASVDASTAAQTAAGLDPRVSGLPPVPAEPAPVSGPQGVPPATMAPGASARAEVMTAANPRATPPVTMLPEQAETAANPTTVAPKAPYEIAIEQAKAQGANPADLLTKPTSGGAVRSVFDSLKVKPTDTEVSNAVLAYNARLEAGTPISLGDAVLQQIQRRHGVPKAATEALARKLAEKLGLPAAEDVVTGPAQHARGVTGKWKAQEVAMNTFRGGDLFHGTTAQQIATIGNQGEIYLTDNAAEAQGYAEGRHAPGQTRGTPVTVRMAVKPGKSLNISADIEKAMMADEFEPEWLDAKIAKARDEGYRYVEYDHPSFSGDGEQHVVVSLHPSTDLGPPVKTKP